MNKNQAKKLAKYYNFTKKELYDILREALKSLPSAYWVKPNPVNKLFDNGYYFNRCVEWLGYEEGINDGEICREFISYRILQGFGKFSKKQIPKKPDYKPEKLVSQKPSLIINKKL